MFATTRFLMQVCMSMAPSPSDWSSLVGKSNEKMVVFRCGHVFHIKCLMGQLAGRAGVSSRITTSLTSWLGSWRMVLYPVSAREQDATSRQAWQKNHVKLLPNRVYMYSNCLSSNSPEGMLEKIFEPATAAKSFTDLFVV